MFEISHQTEIEIQLLQIYLSLPFSPLPSRLSAFPSYMVSSDQQQVQVDVCMARRCMRIMSFLISMSPPIGGPALYVFLEECIVSKEASLAEACQQEAVCRSSGMSPPVAPA